MRRLPLVAPDAPLSASQSHLTLYGIATREPAALAGLGLGRELVRAICALVSIYLFNFLFYKLSNKIHTLNNSWLHQKFLYILKFKLI